MVDEVLVRLSLLTRPSTLLEVSREWLGRFGRHPADTSHAPHLVSAVDWLTRAQDAVPDGGIARGYSLLWDPSFRGRGWQPAYPETTGYIIPTLFAAARALEREDLARRAIRAAHWEIAVQLPSGAVQGGVIGAPVSPALFNTGQVILGWLAAFQETEDTTFADAACRAGRFMVATQDDDGHWRRGNSQFARGDSTLYNARAAWALAEAGVRLGEPTFTRAAARNLRGVARLQAANGWLPSCCLSDPERPLLHTLAYAMRGLLEGGRVLGDHHLIQSAVRAAEPLRAAVRDDGSMPGRFAADWSPAVRWSCLTGQAQMANNWMRLAEITGDNRWLDPVPRVVTFLKTTQNRASGDLGLRGGIKGSAPIWAQYGAFEVLNWATKFFADALMRHARLAGARVPHDGGAFALA